MNRMHRIPMRFARKARTLEEAWATLGLETSTCVIEKVVQLDVHQFDWYSRHLMDDFDDVAGEGGYLSNDHTTRRVVRVTDGTREFFTDPSGSSYCRYVGFPTA